MRLLIADHFVNAFESLKSNRTRTLLTGLGVTIGVASITAICALSAGVDRIVSRQISALNDNIAVIRPSSSVSSGDLAATQSFASSTLTVDDYKEVSQLDGVKQAAPLMVINSSAKSGDSTAEATVVASTPSLGDLAQLEVRDGQFIDEVTNQQTAVIGQQLSLDLYGTEQSIGQTLTIRGQRFTVIGVLKSATDPINFNLVDFDHAAIIHLEAGRSLLGGSALLQQINFQADNAEVLTSTTKTIANRLTATHHGETDFSIISGQDVATPTSKLFQTVQSVVIAVAAIALIVGGIGVMNIMLVNVAERTREIGLRKAIGATNMHIVMQFLVESILIGVAGGLLGYVVGYIAAFAISTFLPITPSFTWWIAGVAALMSLIVGVVFGLYPALKAANKDPIESLRYYH